MSTVTLVTDKGEKFERPLVCSFSYTIGGKSYLFHVTKFDGAVPGTVFPDPHRYIVSDARSGCRVLYCRHSMREGILGAAQAAVDALVKKYGAARVRRTLDAATPIKP